MTYIIAEPCIGVKDTACVDVCPVDCIHPTKNETEEFEKENKLYIDPEECIDCGACEPVCPVEAIFEEAATPEKWKQFIQIDAHWFKKKKGGVPRPRDCISPVERLRKFPQPFFFRLLDSSLISVVRRP